MVKLQPIRVSTSVHTTSVFVRIRNRPNYQQNWIERALQGLGVAVSPVIHAEGEWWQVTAAGDDASLKALEEELHRRFEQADQAYPVFEPPPSHLAKTA